MFTWHCMTYYIDKGDRCQISWTILVQLPLVDYKISNIIYNKHIVSILICNNFVADRTGWPHSLRSNVLLGLEAEHTTKPILETQWVGLQIPTYTTRHWRIARTEQKPVLSRYTVNLKKTVGLIIIHTNPMYICHRKKSVLYRSILLTTSMTSREDPHNRLD